MTVPSMPSDLEAEEALLGAILLDPDMLYLVNIQREHFWNAENAKIFQAISKVREGDERVDFLTVSKQGIPFERLLGLANGVPTSQNAETYAARVVKAHVQRQIIQAAGRIAGLAYDGRGKGAAELVAEAEKVLHEVEAPLMEDGIGMARAMEMFHERLLEFLNNPKESWGIPTWLDIDSSTGGMQPGDLWVIAADPGKGKSALVMTIMQNVAKAGKRALFFSVEMGLDALLLRMVADAADVNTMDVRRGRVDTRQRERLLDQADSLRHLPITFYFHTADTASIRAAVARQREAPAVIAVDYSRLLRDTAESEVARMELISRKMKGLARDFETTVLLVHTLKREAFNNKPSMADLGWSYQMAYDVDVLVFPWFDRNRAVGDLSASIILGKQRNGPGGVEVQMCFDGTRARWANLARG